MKGRYITTTILLACLSKPEGITKDIHVQLKETIAEHKRVMHQLERFLSPEEKEDFHMPGKNAA